MHEILRVDDCRFSTLNNFNVIQCGLLVQRKFERIHIDVNVSERPSKTMKNHPFMEIDIQMDKHVLRKVGFNRLTT